MARKNAIRARMKSAASVDSSERATITPAIRAITTKPRRVGFRSPKKRRTSGGHVGTSGKQDREKRSADEPPQPPARLRRRVQPGREHGGERERPVEVVQAVGCAVVPREEEQAEADLRDE